MHKAERDSVVLVVDDDPAVGKVLVGLLKQGGIDAQHAKSAEDALRAFSSVPVDAVVTDMRMPGMDGLALLRELKQRAPEVPVVMLTAHGSIPLAVEAMRAGAADFMTKPFDRDEVLYTVRKALTLTAGAVDAPPGLSTSKPTLLGGSAKMKEVLDVVRRAARASSNVLIRGESGTGKEVAARAIHEESARRTGPFVAVNCAALPEQLLESELFGYEKGAFTGAMARKPGRVELASGGTLFLDEIGDVPLAVQAKLLRLLQEKEYQPLGGTRTEKAEVRFIAATHRELESMISEGEFREDLYYRLNVIPIWMPPLRERPEDISEMVQRFCDTLARDNKRPGLEVADAAVRRLHHHTWPGNVRELMCVVERLVVFTDADLIEEADVVRELDRLRPRGPASAPPVGAAPSNTSSLMARRTDAERDAVMDALRRARQNRTQAARLLGISRRALYKRLTDFGLLDAS